MQGGKNLKAKLVGQQIGAGKNAPFLLLDGIQFVTNDQGITGQKNPICHAIFFLSQARHQRPQGRGFEGLGQQ